MSKVLSMLVEIDKALHAAEVEMIISVDPLTFEQRDIEWLWECFPKYTSEEMLAKHSIGQSQNIGEAALMSADQEIAGLKV
jgi:hypothetical protein